MLKANKLLILLLILSLISCTTLGNKKPTVKKTKPKISTQLSKNKNKNDVQNSYYKSQGNFLPKDLDKSIKNFTANAGKFFNDGVRNFQINMKNLLQTFPEAFPTFMRALRNFLAGIIKIKNRLVCQNGGMIFIINTSGKSNYSSESYYFVRRNFFDINRFVPV